MSYALDRSSAVDLTDGVAELVRNRPEADNVIDNDPTMFSIDPAVNKAGEVPGKEQSHAPMTATAEVIRGIHAEVIRGIHPQAAKCQLR